VELTVTVGRGLGDSEAQPFKVQGGPDVMAVGHAVSRIVRDYVSHYPIGGKDGRMVIGITCSWGESKKPAPKKKARKRTAKSAAQPAGEGAAA
jgi:hypothetical protein